MTRLKARPTVYKGIQMRSRLEATFASFLDDFGFRWEYEPKCFAAPGREQYLPDFMIPAPTWFRDRERVTLYIEVKSEPELQDDERRSKHMHRMEVIWESEPLASLLIICGDNFRHMWFRSRLCYVCDDGWVPARWDIRGDSPPLRIEILFDEPMLWHYTAS